MRSPAHVAMQDMQNTGQYSQYNQHDAPNAPNPMVVVTSNASNDTHAPPGPTAAAHPAAPGASHALSGALDALDVDAASTPRSSTGSQSTINNMNNMNNMTSLATQRPCVLCQYHGNTAVVTKRILAYMEDAVNHVHRDEICQQVSEELQNYDLDVTPDEVRVHMEQHMINKHVILSTVVSDLMGIARASKQSCMLTSDETGQPAVDPKYASIYFKAVDQLTSILRSDAFKGRSGPAP